MTVVISKRKRSKHTRKTFFKTSHKQLYRFKICKPSQRNLNYHDTPKFCMSYVNLLHFFYFVNSDKNDKTFIVSNKKIIYPHWQKAETDFSSTYLCLCLIASAVTSLHKTFAATARQIHQFSSDVFFYAMDCLPPSAQSITFNKKQLVFNSLRAPHTWKWIMNANFVNDDQSQNN